MILLTIFTISLIISGCTAQSAELEETVKRVPVSVETVRLGSISDTYYGIGQLYANDEFEIMTGNGGTIDKINVEIGSQVKKDQILFQLENYKLSNQIQSQESQLRTQKDATSIALKNAERKLQQTKALFDANAVSQNEYNLIQDQYNQAQIAYNNASKVYTSSMRSLKNELSDTAVKSPIDGIVAAIYVEEGEDVESITAMKIVNNDAMKAIVHIPEKMIPYIKKGQEANVWINGNKDTYVKGTVSKIDLTTQETMSLYPVEIVIDNPNGALLSGMFIETEIMINHKKDTVVIAKTSVLNDGQMILSL